MKSPQSRARRVIASAVLFGAACLVALLLGEGVLRLMPKGSQKYRTVSGDSIHVRDAQLGWRAQPRARFTVRSPEYRTDVVLNALGGRGPEKFGDTAACRALIIGDSFVAGYAVPDSALFYARVPGCETIAVGTEGYATDQELILARELLRTLRPTHVVVAFYQNDVWCNAQATCEDTQKPVLHGAVEVDTAPASVRSLTPRALPPPPPESPAGPVLRVKRWLARNSVLYQTVRGAMGRDRGVIPVASSIAVRPLADEFRVLHQPYDADIAAAWRATESILRDFRALADSSRAEFRILHIPIRENVYRKEWDVVSAAQGMPDEWQPDRVEAHLRDVCTRQKYRCVSPAEALRASGERTYFFADPHWTVAGHAIVRNTLAGLLAQGQ